MPALVTRKLFWMSKNAPKSSVFNDFNFQIALARRHGTNFAEINFQKCSRYANFLRLAWYKFCRDQFPKVLRAYQFLTILISESLSRAGVVQFLSIFWAVDPSYHLAFRTYLCFASPRSHEIMEKHSMPRNSYPPKSLMSHICAVKHLCCPTSMLRDLPAIFQYSRKLEFLNFLW